MIFVAVGSRAFMMANQAEIDSLTRTRLTHGLLVACEIPLTQQAEPTQLSKVCTTTMQKIGLFNDADVQLFPSDGRFSHMERERCTGGLC